MIVVNGTKMDNFLHIILWWMELEMAIYGRKLIVQSYSVFKLKKLEQIMFSSFPFQKSLYINFSQNKCPAH